MSAHQGYYIPQSYEDIMCFSKKQSLIRNTFDTLVTLTQSQMSDQKSPISVCTSAAVLRLRFTGFSNVRAKQFLDIC